MTSTFFGHLHVHLQEFLYIGCFTNSAGPQPQHQWHNTTCGSETTYI